MQLEDSGTGLPVEGAFNSVHIHGVNFEQNLECYWSSCFGDRNCSARRMNFDRLTTVRLYSGWLGPIPIFRNSGLVKTKDALQ